MRSLKLAHSGSRAIQAGGLVALLLFLTPGALLGGSGSLFPASSWVFRDDFSRPDSAVLENGWVETSFLGEVHLRQQRAEFSFLNYGGMFDARHALQIPATKAPWAMGLNFRVVGTLPPQVYDDRQFWALLASGPNSGLQVRVYDDFFQLIVYENGIPLDTDYVHLSGVFGERLRLRMSRCGDVYSAELTTLGPDSQPISLSVVASLDLRPDTLRIHGENGEADSSGTYSTTGAFDDVFFVAAQ